MKTFSKLAIVCLCISSIYIFSFSQNASAQNLCPTIVISDGTIQDSVGGAISPWGAPGCGNTLSAANLNVATFKVTATDPDGNNVTVSYTLSPPPFAPFNLTFSPMLPQTAATVITTATITCPNLTVPYIGLLRIFAVDNQGCTTQCIMDIDWLLPVELSSFVSIVNGNDVTLRWTTTSETNNSGFDIERANGNSSEWNKIGTVSGSGTSNQPISYSFADRGMNVGNYNYRLKQVDLNGNFKYYNLSNEVVIGVPVKFDLSQNYPNPFNPSTKIDFELAKAGNVSLNVYDMSGRQVSTIANGFKTAGYYTVQFNASNLASGIYYYKIQYSGDQPFEKVMKMALVK